MKDAHSKAVATESAGVLFIAGALVCPDRAKDQNIVFITAITNT